MLCCIQSLNYFPVISREPSAHGCIQRHVRRRYEWIQIRNIAFFRNRAKIWSFIFFLDRYTHVPRIYTLETGWWPLLNRLVAPVSRFSSIHWHSVSPSSLFSTKPIQNTLDDTSTRVSSLMSRMAPIFSLLILTVISGDGKSRFKVHDRLAVCVNLRLSARPFWKLFLRLSVSLQMGHINELVPRPILYTTSLHSYISLEQTMSVVETKLHHIL